MFVLLLLDVLWTCCFCTRSSNIMLLWQVTIYSSDSYINLGAPAVFYYFFFDTWTT
uniref:Uncharacterized protein n=1 Tax=Arundo donax TaxID=35708 RepID=A0A0A9AA62_ARUDO